MDYNPSYDDIEVGSIGIVEPLGFPSGFYWIRLQDTHTTEIQDIPIHGEDVVYWWSYGLGRCDCVRWRAFNEIKRKAFFAIPCNSRPGNRMRLLGIWNRGGEQIHPGEP